MATFDMDNYALRSTVPPTPVDNGDYKGVVRNSYDQLNTVAATHTTGSIFNIGELLPGERFLGGEIVHAAHGSSRTLKVGIAGADDQFLAATSIAAAGSLELRAMTGFGYRNTTKSPIPIIATLGGAAAATASPGFKVALRIGRN